MVSFIHSGRSLMNSFCHSRKGRSQKDLCLKILRYLLKILISY
ncbi:hypothetical protein PN456_20440 [Nodularia spumigena CS-586/05]|nr:hypothetical protein [Nodularia spumigena]MDB9371278.1 hypothetical protein [Nodularia spumigena CS-586/05]